MDEGGNHTSSYEISLGLIIDILFENETLPKEFSLSNNYPNPFNPSTKIKYELPKSTEIKLNIYNIIGQKVRAFVDHKQPAGFHLINWDGRNDRGIKMATGVYFYQIITTEYVKTKQMLLLK